MTDHANTGVQNSFMQELDGELKLVPEPWQRMHTLLELLAIECAKGPSCDQKLVAAFARLGQEVFSGNVVDHIPNGAIPLSAAGSQLQAIAAQHVLTRIAKADRCMKSGDEPGKLVPELEDSLAWIESHLRPIYKETWVQEVDVVRRARLGSARGSSSLAHKAPAHSGEDPVHRTVARIVRLLVCCREVVDAWQTFERRRTALPKRSRIPNGMFIEPPTHVTTETELDAYWKTRRSPGRGLHPSWAPASSACDRLVLAVRRWRLELDAARESLPAVAQWMDDRREPQCNRWSAQVQRDLRRLGGHINRLTDGDMPRGFDVEAFLQQAERVEGCLAGLRSVEGQPPLPQLVSAGGGGVSAAPAGTKAVQMQHSIPPLPDVSAKGEPTDPTPPMSIRKAAGHMDCDPRTLRRSMAQGIIQFARRGNKKWVFALADFTAKAREKLRGPAHVRGMAEERET